MAFLDDFATIYATHELHRAVIILAWCIGTVYILVLYEFFGFPSLPICLSSRALVGLCSVGGLVVVVCSIIASMTIIYALLHDDVERSEEEQQEIEMAPIVQELEDAVRQYRRYEALSITD